MTYRLTEQDEFPHQPDDDSNFNESVYCNAFDPEQRVGGWMRIGNRVNEGYAELSVCLYLPGGRVACQFLRPKISTNDAFDAGGLRVETPEPHRRQDWSFEGEAYVLENPEVLRDPRAMMRSAPTAPARVNWTATAASPMHGGEPTDPSAGTMYGREFSRGHFNQHMACKGEIIVGAEHFEIDGFGWRDHSWGPRLWQNIHWYRLLIFNCGPDRGGMFLKIWDPELGRARRVGVLLADGEYEEIVDLEIVTTRWSERRDPVEWVATVQTAERRVIVEGRVMTLAPLRNRREIDGETVTSRVAEGFTQVRWGDRTGYGMTEYIERLDADGVPVGWPL